MSDQRLRQLERRWKETGSVEDEAAYLRERVRVGDLSQERLELAAYCGHEGAVAAIGRQPCDTSTDGWLIGLTRRGRQAPVQLGHLVCRQLLPLLAHLPEVAKLSPEIDSLSHAIAEWATHPCSSHLQQAISANHRLLLASQRDDPVPVSSKSDQMVGCWTLLTHKAGLVDVNGLVTLVRVAEELGADLRIAQAALARQAIVHSSPSFNSGAVPPIAGATRAVTRE